MKKFYIIILIFGLIGCASKTYKTYMGHEIMNVSFVIAGGDVVYLPVTDAGPIPAESNGFRMEYAGFSVGESKVNEHKAELVWGFALSSTSTEEIQNIVIEELAPTKTIKLLTKVEKPKFVNGYWKINLKPIVANKINTPWIFRDKASIYVFRITINLNSGKQITLMQPAWFSKLALATFAKQISLIENKNTQQP